MVPRCPSSPRPLKVNVFPVARKSPALFAGTLAVSIDDTVGMDDDGILDLGIISTK